MESFDILASELPVLLFRAGVAVLCGGIVGIERELRKKPAGFRTNILICLGAALYMMISERIASGAGAGQMADPGRVAAQVVTGIGFLGAGTIIRARGHVHGLTSAAMIWMVAALGLFVGAGYPVSAFILTVLTVLTLTPLGIWERRLLGKCIVRDCRVRVEGEPGDVRNRIERALRIQRVPIEGLRLSRDEAGATLMTFPVCSNHPAHRGFLAELWEIEQVTEVESLK